MFETNGSWLVCLEVVYFIMVWLMKEITGKKQILVSEKSYIREYLPD